MNSTCAMFRNEQKEYQRCTINKLDCFAMIKTTAFFIFVRFQGDDDRAPWCDN